MSPSAYITRRKVKSGFRFVVRFRFGGRYTKLVHAGSFRTHRDAKLRRDFVITELAAGRDPLVALRTVGQAVQFVTLEAWFDRFIESRVDVGPKTKSLYRNSKATLGDLADRDPATLRASDFQTWVAENAELAPKTLRHYLSSIRQVLDFAEIEPNPARSRKVKLPSKDSAEVSPPSSAEWQAIRDTVAKRLRLPLSLMECCGLRVGETIQLTYGDIDFQGERIRVSRARTKGRTAGQRWVRVPAELVEELDGLLPLEDRHVDRTVFSLTEEQMRYGMARACRDAKIAHYHPHDLRHRRISLWVAHRIDPRTVSLWSGHSRTQMSLDTYSHVLIDGAADEWRDFWLDVYTSEREALVRSHDKEDT